MVIELWLFENRPNVLARKMLPGGGCSATSTWLQHEYRTSQKSMNLLCDARYVCDAGDVSYVQEESVCFHTTPSTKPWYPIHSSNMHTYSTCCYDGSPYSLPRYAALFVTKVTNTRTYTHKWYLQVTCTHTGHVTRNDLHIHAAYSPRHAAPCHVAN